MIHRYPRFLNIAACCILVLQSLTAQTNVVSTKISLADWGVDSLKEIRFGVLAINQDKGTDRLKVSLLRNEEPKGRTTTTFVSAEHRPPADTTRNRSLSRATWVWNTDDLLSDSAQAQAMLSVIVQAHFDRTFLHLPNNFAADTSHDNQLSSLVAELHARGIRAYALAGDPQFCLTKNHATVLRLVHRVIDFNKTVGANARFVGVHLDIEPYLLPGFGGTRKYRILEQYLTITERATQAAHEGGLLFGTDIPFWYGLPDEFTGEIDSVEFGGTKKPVSEHVTDLADEICIMSYRTNARGLNGIVTLSEDELAYAEPRGKKVLVGLETSDLPDEQNVYFQGIPTSDPRMLGNSDRVICMIPQKDSAAVFFLERGQIDSLILSTGGDPREPDRMFFWEIRSTSSVPSTKLSFAKLGKDRLDETIGILIRELGDFASFGGVAIHHEASYAALPK